MPPTKVTFHTRVVVTARKPQCQELGTRVKVYSVFLKDPHGLFLSVPQYCDVKISFSVSLKSNERELVSAVSMATLVLGAASVCFLAPPLLWRLLRLPSSSLSGLFVKLLTSLLREVTREA